jgi:hypothetical protein
MNYLDNTVPPSLFRNGQVKVTRYPDGSDSPMIGVIMEQKEVTILDAREVGEGERWSCHANGFELLHVPLEPDNIDFFDQFEVADAYYRQCARLVSEVTGAQAYAFDHNIRSWSGQKSGKRVAGEQKVQPPIHLVHGDYTLTSGPQRLRDLTRPPSKNDTLRRMLPEGGSLIEEKKAEHALSDGRFAIINVWRNISDAPVETYPLALCDGFSVAPQDLVVFEIHYQDRIGENYFARHSPSHCWYYYPKMTRDEVLLIKQWDSEGVLARSHGQQADSSDINSPCTFSFHSAFDDPATPLDAPDRWSIEVRCMVIYE